MLQRSHPANELRRMQDTMDRLWRGFGGASSASSDGTDLETWAIPLDVLTKGDDIIVRASMPGVTPTEIQVSIEDNVLTIRGESTQQEEDADANYLMRERRVGSFHRGLRLPETVDTDKAETRYDNGVLTVTIPKAESKKARRLEVQVGSSD